METSTFYHKIPILSIEKTNISAQRLSDKNGKIYQFRQASDEKRKKTDRRIEKCILLKLYTLNKVKKIKIFI